MTDFERDIEIETPVEDVNAESTEADGTLSGRIEAILFVAGEPVRIEDLACGSFFLSCSLILFSCLLVISFLKSTNDIYCINNSVFCFLKASLNVITNL